MPAQPDEHLFRHESGRMLAALTRVLGVHNLGLAEDAVQEAFCRAIAVWPMRGMPENPSAWLMATAKNWALDAVRRQKREREFAPELGRLLQSEWTLAGIVHELFADNAIKDNLLRMMFSCCHPQLSEEAQVALMLQILCGFSSREIAAAFVTGLSAIEKRVQRGKKVLADSRRLFEVDSADEFSKRLPTVQRALYLLFNEGYHSACPEAAVRRELCDEAMRLTAVLLEHPSGRTPGNYALAALMRFHAARLPARLDAGGNLASLHDQDRSLWNRQMIDEGLRLLDMSAEGEVLSEYHLEAAIASIHSRSPSAEETDFNRIVNLYEMLMKIRPSPIVALNRAIAVGQVAGAAPGLEAILAIEDGDRLGGYPFYWAAIAEFELKLNRQASAREHFTRALAATRNPAEKKFISGRLAKCDAPPAVKLD